MLYGMPTYIHGMPTYIHGMPTYIHGMPTYIHKQHLKIIPKSRNSCMHLICVYSCELSGHE